MRSVCLNNVDRRYLSSKILLGETTTSEKMHNQQLLPKNKHQTVIYTSSEWTLPFSDLSVFALTYLSCDFFQWRCMQGIFCAAIIPPPPRCLLVFSETFYNPKYPVNTFRVIVCTIPLISLTLISTLFFPQTS